MSVATTCELPAPVPLSIGEPIGNRVASNASPETFTTTKLPVVALARATPCSVSEVSRFAAVALATRTGRRGYVAASKRTRQTASPAEIEPEAVQFVGIHSPP